MTFSTAIGMHDADAVARGGEGEDLGHDLAEVARLHLDELAVGAHEVDDLALHAGLEAVARAPRGIP